MSVNRSVQILLMATFFMNLGTFSVFTFLAIYLAKSLSFSPVQVGAVLTTLMVTSRVLPVFGGSLADKMGYSRAMVIGMAARGLGFLAFSFAESFSWAISAAALTGLGTALYEPAVSAFFSRQDEENRKRGFTYFNQALNAGAITGPLIGGLLIHYGAALPFLFGSFLYFLISIFLFLFRTQFMVEEGEPVSINVLKTMKDRPFMMFNGTMCLFWVMYSQLTIMYPLLMYRITQSQTDVSLVVTVNATSGLLIMFLIRRMFETKAPIPLIIKGMILMSSALAISWFLPDKWWLLLCVVLFTLGETFVLPAADIQVSQFSMGKGAGTYFGISKISFGVGASTGSFIGPVLFESGGWAGFPWMVVAAIGFTGALAMFLISKSNVG